MILNKVKLYSIRSGGYSGGRRSYWGLLPNLAVGSTVGMGTGALLTRGDKPGVVMGAITGALIGLFNWIDSCHRINGEGSFNTPDIIECIANYIRSRSTHSVESTTTSVGGVITSRGGGIGTSVSTTTSQQVDPNTYRYLLRSGYSFDQDPSKCNISLHARRGHIIMILNELSNRDISDLDDAFDNICHDYHRCNYTSTKIRSNTYLVDFKFPDLETAWTFIEVITSMGIKPNILVNKYIPKR